MNSIKLIHKANLNLLKEVDRICQKYNIEYFIDSGTLLGAVRHHGFIPWDDDIDMVIKRENLEYFCKICQQELDSKYQLIMPSDFNNHFFDFVPRIVIKNSQLRKVTSEDEYYGNMQNKVALDIFIIDNAAPNWLMQKFHSLLHKSIYGLAMGHRFHIDYGKYSLTNKFFIKILAAIGKHISIKRIFAWQTKVAILYNMKESDYCMMSNYNLPYLEYIFEKKWYQDSIRMLFEGYELNCPKGWDNILKMLYGDYMKLPDEADRIYAHMDKDTFLLDTFEG